MLYSYGTVVRGASFYGTGLTTDQLYSTASYQNGDLAGIDFSHNDLSGWDLAGKNLSDSGFSMYGLSGTDFSRADLRGVGFSDVCQTCGGGSILHNTISSAGHVNGLMLDAAERLIVRDYNGYVREEYSGPVSRDPIPITVESTMTFDTVSHGFRNDAPLSRNSISRNLPAQTSLLGPDLCRHSSQPVGSLFGSMSPARRSVSNGRSDSSLQFRMKCQTSAVSFFSFLVSVKTTEGGLKTLRWRRLSPRWVLAP